MDYTNLLNDKSGKKSKVGIIGATRGYGYTLLAQIPKVQLMELRVICSRHPEECLAVLKEIGYNEKNIVHCEDREAIAGADEQAILIEQEGLSQPHFFPYRFYPPPLWPLSTRKRQVCSVDTPPATPPQLQAFISPTVLLPTIGFSPP